MTITRPLPQSRNSPKRHIGFFYQPSSSWMAGTSLLKAYAHALRSVYGDRVRCTAIIDEKKKTRFDEVKENFDDVLMLPHAIKGFVSGRVSHENGEIGKVLKRHGIQAGFGFNLRIRTGGIPALSWIPDFQYKHLPEAFSLNERLIFENMIRESSECSEKVIVMSEAVRRDFETFFPEYNHKARVVHPVSQIDPGLYDTSPETVANFYHLPEKFFYCPNQLWKHKNHETLLNAVRTLKEEGVDVFVVLSGLLFDKRHPQYASELLTKISTWDIQSNVILLGFIPREHVFQLMRQSLCVVNPSLFEGFGLSADEAHSMGKKLLLSDIPSHREQNPPRATFVNAQDAKELAFHLREISMWSKPGPDEKAESESKSLYNQRLKRSAEAFYATIGEVIR